MTDQESLLESLHTPADLKRLSLEQLTSLAAEIRQFLVDKVTTTGGHLGPNLGVVELTMAIHRVFDSPRDAVVWDVGHQAYVHKIITGRRADFDGLRLAGGISGYPSRAECEHDLVENSHASTALSYADGLAKAFQLRGERRHVVAVVGDGALTGGMCWEALNNIAAGSNRPMVIVINDNGRSYSHTIGGLADHLASLRLSPGYEKALEGGKRMLQGTPVVGKPIYAALHAAKRGIKDALSPQMMFEDLGLKYFGPVDGHDHVALDAALRRAREFGGPVIVHAVTSKGRGFPLAENDEVDQMHQTDPIDPVTGKPTTAKGPASWTSVFADELARIGDERPDVVAITAAMLRSTGLAKFAEAHPDRWFDVGIAEQHAVTSAAGMAMAGLHPVVAIYSTFLNRAFDQLLMDVALHKLPVTMVLDRAGITGPDGASHHGMWDLSILGAVPGIRIAAPRDAITLREELGEAIAVKDGPTVLRFPKASVGGEVGALERLGPVDVLRRGESSDVLLVTVGAFAELGLAAADRLADQGIGVTVVDPRWVAPVPAELVTLSAQHRLVVTVEDGGRHGGFGWTLAAALRDAELDVPLRDLGIPQEFHGQGTRSEVLVRLGLTAQNVARKVTEWAADRLGEPQSAASAPRHTDA